MDKLLEEYFRLVEESRIRDGDPRYGVLATRMAAAIERLAPVSSAYHVEANGYVPAAMPPRLRASGMARVLNALRDDYAAGYLFEIEQSIRRGVFSDLLDMAAHLLEGYEHLHAATSAGVLAGATLEEYLRKLADANGIATANSGGEPVKAESLNTELRGEGVYDLSEQMQVTAWLDLRNKAARGRRDEFSADQVRLMIQGVRDFTVRHLA